MQLSFVKIGKPAFSQIADVSLEYQKRIHRYMPLQVRSLKETDRDQGKLLDTLKKQNKKFTIVLDKSGQSFSSEKLAEKMNSWIEDPAISEIEFIVGGPYGFDKDFLKQADFIWSLSPNTLTSDMAWLFTNEQIFRAFSIIHKTGYHH